MIAVTTDQARGVLVKASNFATSGHRFGSGGLGVLISQLLPVVCGHGHAEFQCSCCTRVEAVVDASDFTTPKFFNAGFEQSIQSSKLASTTPKKDVASQLGLEFRILHGDRFVDAFDDRINKDSAGIPNEVSDVEFGWDSLDGHDDNRPLLIV